MSLNYNINVGKSFIDFIFNYQVVSWANKNKSTLINSWQLTSYTFMHVACLQLLRTYHTSTPLYLSMIAVMNDDELQQVTVRLHVLTLGVGSMQCGFDCLKERRTNSRGRGKSRARVSA